MPGREALVKFKVVRIRALYQGKSLTV